MQRILWLCFIISLSGYWPAYGRSDKLPVGAQFDVAFSPQGQALGVVIKGINSASHSIQVAAYLFSNWKIAQALMEAERRGVTVQIVADYQEQQGSNVLACLAGKGVQVRLNRNYPLHHHKFMLFDKQHLQLGSLNYTRRAVEDNAENVLLLRHVASLAAVYHAEWQRLWQQAQPLQRQVTPQECYYLEKRSS